MVVKNNNGNETAVEAEIETETEETAAETEEITAETEEITIEDTLQSAETEEERLLRYQAYYNKLLELQEEYGEVSLISLDMDAAENYSAEISYGYQNYSVKLLDGQATVTETFSGLCLARLIDFDGDGTEELLVAYDKETNINESTFESGADSGETYDYTVEVFAYKDGEVESVYQNKPMAVYANADGTYNYKINILYCAGKCFIETGWGENSEKTGSVFYGYDGETFSAECFYGEDLQEVFNYDADEQDDVYEQWCEDVCIRYTYSFEFYITDPVTSKSAVNYADCEETIAYLEEQMDLGLSSDSLDSMYLSSSEQESVLKYLIGSYSSDVYSGSGEAFYFYMNEDGTFSGTYRMGTDDTIEQCKFYGTFTNFKKINNNIYTATVENISYDYEPGTEYTISNKDYLACEAPGLTEGDMVIIYLSGTDGEELINGIGSNLLDYYSGRLSGSFFYDTEYPQTFGKK